jgi:hypothetical protein
MTRRIAIIGATALSIARSSTADPVIKVREFVFFLTRMNSLILTRDNAGYRLCLIQEDKVGEIMRTSFSGFLQTKDTEVALSFEQHYEDPFSDEKSQFISLAVKHEVDPGTRNNRSLNNGDWLLSISGHGTRFNTLKTFLVQHRVAELWKPPDSMSFRGSIVTDEFGEDTDAYIHR